MVLCDRGHENPGGARFCNVCASPLVVRCPRCGHANPAASRFCGECAVKLSDGATSRESLFTVSGALDAQEDHAIRACYAALRYGSHIQRG